MHGFWYQGTYCIFDIRVTDLDGAKYRGDTLEIVMPNQGLKKNSNYLEQFIEMR